MSLRSVRGLAGWIGQDDYLDLPALRDVMDEGDEGSLAACDLCGETYSHDHMEDEYGSFQWDDDTDGGERPVGVSPDEPF